MMEAVIKTFQKGNKYFMILKDNHRTEIEIPKVDYDDINSTNERIISSYKREKVTVI